MKWSYIACRLTGPASGQATTSSQLRHRRLTACHSGLALAEYQTQNSSQRADTDGAYALSCGYGVSRIADIMNFTLEYEQEVDGRWIAEDPELPSVLSYGDSIANAMSKAEILAFCVIADRLENSEYEPVSISFSKRK